MMDQVNSASCSTSNFHDSNSWFVHDEETGDGRNTEDEFVSTRGDLFDSEEEDDEQGTPPSTPPVHTNANPPPALTWAQRFDYVVIGVWVFCSTLLLSMPFAIREGGWIGLCFFLGFSVLTFSSAWFLPNVLDENENKYQELGNTALGAAGRNIAFAMSCIFSYATCIDSVMIEEDNLSHVFGGSLVLTTFVVIGLGLLLWYRNFDEYDPLFPRIGVVLTIILIGCLVYIGSFDVGFHAKTQFFEYPKLHLAVGFYAYCFCGHSYIPRIYNLVNNEREYKKILIVIFFITTLLYASTGCLAYAIYGVDVESIYTLNFPTSSTVSQISIYCTVSIHMIRYLLNMSTLVTTLEGVIPEEWRTNYIRRLIRSLLVLSTLLAFLCTPYYAPIVSLSRSVIGVFMSLTIPSLCFMIIRWGDLTALQTPIHIRRQGMFWALSLLVGILACGFTVVRSIVGINAG